jgi:hypothetical protein
MHRRERISVEDGSIEGLRHVLLFVTHTVDNVRGNNLVGLNYPIATSTISMLMGVNVSTGSAGLKQTLSVAAFQS